MPQAESRLRGSTRATPRLLLWLAGVLLIARVVTGITERLHPQEAVDRVAWISLEQAKASASNKTVLYQFTAAWCAPCRAMQREVFGDAGSAAFISEQFLPVRVIDRSREDGQNPAAVDSLERLFQVQSFPTLVVVEPASGRHYSAVGYQDKGKTLRFLRNPSGKSWKQIIRQSRADSTR
jgi:thiol:disulfide interchange protein